MKGNECFTALVLETRIFSTFDSIFWITYITEWPVKFLEGIGKEPINLTDIKQVAQRETHFRLLAMPLNFLPQRPTQWEVTK